MSVNKTVPDLAAAVAGIESGMTLMVGGFGGSGAPIELVGRRDGDSLAIEISNEGGRIPPDRLRVIFDPFLQQKPADPEASRSSRLGLGLFIAREIALGHGGSIEADSAEKRTTFTIRIPVRAQSRA